MTRLTSFIHSLDNALLDVSPEKQREAHTLMSDLISEGDLHRDASWAAHMTPAIEAPALLGQLLSGLHNGNLLSVELYPYLAEIEKQLLDWLCSIFQHDYAHFTHGSSYANLEALWQARDNTTAQSNIVYGSQAAHYSIIKACQILGLKFSPIPTDSDGIMRVEDLALACQQQPPVAIVATAGSASCGAIDPITACVALSKRYHCWLHIDAAWGGALMLTSQSTLLSGLADANSVSFDPHKALGQPRPCSLLFYQQPLNTFIDIDYLSQPPKQTLAGSYGGELFLPLWCSLLLSGKDSLIEKLTSRLEQAELFYTLLKQQTDWWIHYSPTGIVCFQPSSPYDLSKLIEQGMLSIAKINQRPVYRVVFANHTTSAKKLALMLEQHFSK